MPLCDFLTPLNIFLDLNPHERSSVRYLIMIKYGLLLPVKDMIFFALIRCNGEFYAHFMHGQVEDP